ATPLDSEAMRREMKAALADIDKIATSCVGFISARQQTASNDLAKNLLIIGFLSLAAVLAAILLSVSQYRLVMVPLQRLRQGVRQLAAAKFTQTLDPVAMEKSPEFLDLAGEFNRMAAELNDFYRRLEEQ